MTGQIKKCAECGEEFEDRSFDDMHTTCAKCSIKRANEIIEAGRAYISERNEAWRQIEEE